MNEILNHKVNWLGWSDEGEGNEPAPSVPSHLNASVLTEKVCLGNFPWFCTKSSPKSQSLVLTLIYGAESCVCGSWPSLGFRSSKAPDVILVAIVPNPQISKKLTSRGWQFLQNWRLASRRLFSAPSIFHLLVCQGFWTSLPNWMEKFFKKVFLKCWILKISFRFGSVQLCLKRDVSLLPVPQKWSVLGRCCCR